MVNFKERNMSSLDKYLTEGLTNFYTCSAGEDTKEEDIIKIGIKRHG